MNKRTTISLDTPFSEFIEQQVGEGHYASASEVVQAGLRLLEEREAYVEAIRAALIEGEESGPPSRSILMNSSRVREHNKSVSSRSEGYGTTNSPSDKKAHDVICTDMS